MIDDSQYRYWEWLAKRRAFLLGNGPIPAADVESNTRKAPDGWTLDPEANVYVPYEVAHQS